MIKMKRILLLLLVIGIFELVNAQDKSITNQEGIESEISITTNPNNPDEIIISSMGHNSPIIIYTSNDGGDNWNQSSFGNGLADPNLTYGDNNTAYLTFLDFGSTLEMSLGKSSDNGNTWEIVPLTLDGKAADRPWLKRDNNLSSPFYGNKYISYFHPEDDNEIHIVKIDNEDMIGSNHSIHETTFDYVQNPAMDIALDGTIVICFIAESSNGQRKIVAVHSKDGSQTFSTDSHVSDIYMFDSNGNPVSDVIGFAPGPASRIGNSLQMAIDKSTGPNSGRVYLSWTDFIKNTPEEGMNIYLSYSDDNGISWSTPTIVNDDLIQGSHQYYAGIDVNPSGILCLSWYDRRTDPIDNALTDFYFTHSIDGGSSFKPSAKVNSITSDHTAITNGATTFGVGEYTSLTTTDKNAYVVWADGRENNGNMDVYFAKIALDNINSIKEQKLYATITIRKIFPNPIKGTFVQLDIDTKKQQNIDIQLLNIHGQVIQNFPDKLEHIGINTIDLNLKGLSSGKYIIRISHEDGIATQKLLIH